MTCPNDVEENGFVTCFREAPSNRIVTLVDRIDYCTTTQHQEKRSSNG